MTPKLLAFFAYVIACVLMLISCALECLVICLNVVLYARNTVESISEFCDDTAIELIGKYWIK